MKRFISLLVLLNCLTCFSQSLLTNDYMYQLPRTADDFQNYQFDYPLENGMDVRSSYYMDSDFSAFDDVEIYPFELQERTKVKSILCAVYQNNNYLAVFGKATYNRKGELTNYESKNKISENYAFGVDKWSQVRGVPRRLINCIPNSFTYETRPTRNSKGLITNVESELTYKYDSHDRVIEVILRNGMFSYQYEYVGDSKRIKKITVYKSGRLSADANYGYSNNKIVSVDCNQLDNVRVENHKSYKYDSHNNISEIIFIQKKSDGAEKNIHYSFNNKYDSKGRIIESQISRMRTQRVGHYTSGSDKTPTFFIRKYTYDEHGNWIKIADNEGFIQRTIEYWSSSNGANNDIYDEDDVTVNATFGQTFANYFKKHGNILYPIILEENGIRVSTPINVSFIVEKDGSISNMDIQMNSSEKESFIKNTEYQIKKLSWIPATIDGKPVRCNINVGFRTTRDFDVIVTKDIKFTDAERKAYSEGRRNDEGTSNSNPSPIQQSDISKYEENILGQVGKNWNLVLESLNNGKDATEHFRKVDSLLDEFAKVQNDNYHKRYEFVILHATTKAQLQNYDKALNLCKENERRLNQEDMSNVNVVKLLFSTYELAILICNFLDNKQMANEYTRKLKETAKKVLKLDPNDIKANNILK